ncbi:putative bifunctional diguanylate cyclase/phosphodiesterase [Granulicella tundricola]|uniref:putative bifunctional diguanylate cyclase/phosphodiesterase n=1 Tax=Granulicella tundricola TaxID=940615 RepID=UPI0018DD0B28|nr:EAL domain-containing protein [Granulicella tundricola]
MNVAKEAERLFRSEHRLVCTRTDRLFAILMSLQWPAAVAAALLISSRTWVGGTSSVHPHLIAAVYLGGLITVPPVLLAFFRPGERYTRHIIAACQMLMSGLLIHVSGGRIETHFHVFGSLAFLAFYLDWEVLATATLVTLVDHLAMGYYLPASIFGTATASHWRLLEHVLWVVFFDIFLITSCVQGLKWLHAVARREADQELLLYQAYHDALTGLGNRLQIQKLMGELLMPGSKEPRPFALMAIDLDRFKEVNDTLGHQVGDELLRQVSQRLMAQIRKNDTLVRMGGDEFALVLDGCTSARVAESIAGRMVESLNKPFSLGDHTARIGASIGICLHLDEGQDATDLFHHADLALYKVKNSGRNSFMVFDENMRAETLHQMSMEHRLRSAVLENQMHLHYQPIVSTEGRLLGFEALLRWNDAVHGDVSPVDFIPLAEKTGLIIPLGAWVLQQACSQAAQWHRTGNKLMKMSVNVSSIQLAHKDFVTTVLTALKETGLPAELLDLELTESALIQQHDSSYESLHLLRRFGVKLSIDDFGTGYSSLSYLRDLPVHTLKIDRAFVKDIEISPESRTLVEGMIDMAHTLHLRVVAEGVENRKQMEILVEAGCDEIQGFHISKAVPADDARRFINVSHGEPEIKAMAGAAKVRGLAEVLAR